MICLLEHFTSVNINIIVENITPSSGKTLNITLDTNSSIFSDANAVQLNFISGFVAASPLN
jgi:hypothetical protein